LIRILTEQVTTTDTALGENARRNNSISVEDHRGDERGVDSSSCSSGVNYFQDCFGVPQSDVLAALESTDLIRADAGIFRQFVLLNPGALSKSCDRRAECAESRTGRQQAFSRHEAHLSGFIH